MSCGNGATSPLPRWYQPTTARASATRAKKISTLSPRGPTSLVILPAPSARRVSSRIQVRYAADPATMGRAMISGSS